MQYRKSFVNKRGKAWRGGMMGRGDKGGEREGGRGKAGEGKYEVLER